MRARRRMRGSGLNGEDSARPEVPDGTSGAPVGGEAGGGAEGGFVGVGAPSRSSRTLAAPPIGPGVTHAWTRHAISASDLVRRGGTRLPHRHERREHRTQGALRSLVRHAPASGRPRSRMGCRSRPCRPEGLGGVGMRSVVRPVQWGLACAVVFAEVGTGTMCRQLPDRFGVSPAGGRAQRCALRAEAAALGVGRGTGFHEQTSRLGLALHRGQVQRGGAVTVPPLRTRSTAQQLLRARCHCQDCFEETAGRLLLLSLLHNG